MRLKKTGSATRDITEETPGASEDAILVEADKAFLGYALLSLSATLPIYTGFYERSHGDTIEFRPENLRVCLDYLYEWTCQILVKSADQFSSN